MIDEVRKMISDSHDIIEKNLLKLVLGSLQQLNNPTKDDFYKIVEKIFAGNLETIGLMGEDVRKNNLIKENEILSNYLPKYLTKEQLVENLNVIKHEFDNLKNEGQKIGHAIKYLKSKNLVFKNEDVKLLIKSL